MLLALLAAVWVPLAPVLIPRQEVAVVAANGKLHLIGGIAADRAILSTVEEYDPITNRWSLVAPLPAPRHHAAAAAIADAIYVIGGFESLAFDPQRTVYRYDLSTGVWTEVAPLPAARGALAAAAINGKIYAVGGVPGNGRDLNVYDPATNAWTTLAPMPTGREHLAAATAGGMLYVAGGRLAGNTNALERYDPVTNIWTSLPPMPTARGGLAAAAVGNRIFVFGGEGNPNKPTGVFEETESFDIVTSTWRSEPAMLVPRHGIGAAALGVNIHIPAGAAVQGFGTSDVHDMLVTQTSRRRSANH